MITAKEASEGAPSMESVRDGIIAELDADVRAILNRGSTARKAYVLRHVAFREAMKMAATVLDSAGYETLLEPHIDNHMKLEISW